MSYGILFLRLAFGLIVAAHGAQKLFGSFGGHGLRGTGGFFGTLGFRAPLLMALAAGMAEFGGGLLLASGLLTPLAALAVAVVMLNAIGSVHSRNGFWNSEGGYEFNLALWAAAVAIAAIGAGRFSLDALIGWADNISGPWWGVGVAGLSVLVSALTLTLGRQDNPARRTVKPAGEEDAARQKAAGPFHGDPLLWRRLADHDGLVDAARVTHRTPLSKIASGVAGPAAGPRPFALSLSLAAVGLLGLLAVVMFASKTWDPWEFGLFSIPAVLFLLALAVGYSASSAGLDRRGRRRNDARRPHARREGRSRIRSPHEGQETATVRLGQYPGS